MSGIDMLYDAANQCLESTDAKMRELGVKLSVIAGDIEVAALWVDDHGGIEEVVNMHWFANKCAQIISGKPEGTGDGVELLNELRRRLMPEGYEWPRFEDGEPVRFGDAVEVSGGCMTVRAVEYSNGETFVKDACDGDWGTSFGVHGPLIRPKPDPIGADGLPIKKGDELYITNEAKNNPECPCVDGEPLVVTGIAFDSDLPVYALDQYDMKQDGLGPWELAPSWLTHTKPEPPDSWDQLEEDAEALAHLFDNFDSNASGDIREMVQRAKKLADKDN